MPRHKILQTNCSAGELAPELWMRHDTEQYQNGAKSLRNRRCMIGGGTKRRPGSWWQDQLVGLPRTEDFIVTRAVSYVLSFTDGRVDAYRVGAGGTLTAAGSVTGTEWTGTIFLEMDYEQSGDTAFLMHADMPTQVLTRTGASSWTVTEFAYYIGKNNRPEQPYFKLADDSVTLRPSALEGSITVRRSSGTFTDEQVGTYIRYLGRAILITAVTSPESAVATGTVIEKLPKTQLLAVSDPTGFGIADLISGSTSAARGMVTAASAAGSTIYNVTAAAVAAAGNGYGDFDLLEVQGGVGTAAQLRVLVDAFGGVTNFIVEYAGFYTTAPVNPVSFTGGNGTGATANLTMSAGLTSVIEAVLTDKLIPFDTEEVVSETFVDTITDVVDTTPAAVKDWDEQLFSVTNGYPSCGVLHRNRMLFAGCPAAPDALVGSRLNNLYSFDVGDGSDGDGFLETIGDSGAAEIVQLHSAEQLLVLTDRGPYYCPESVANPFRPSSIAFYPFGSTWEITSAAAPRAFDDGVLFVAGSSIIKARPTGNQAQQWAADEVSLVSNHLLSSPSRLAVTSNFDGGPERYAFAINSNGTAALMQLVEAQKIRNFTPWDTDGEYVSACAVGEFLYAAVARVKNGATIYVLELFDQDITLDSATEYASYEDAAIATRYGDATLNVVVDNQYHLGTLPINSLGPPDGPYVIGLNYETELETLPPSFDDPEGPSAGDWMRITEAYVNVIGSQRFAANGMELTAYQITDDLSEPPPVKTGPQRFQFMGWQRDPTLSITQPDPLPLDILAVRSTVAF